MATKPRKDMWEPIKGWVICYGYSSCVNRKSCPHSKLHRWKKLIEARISSESCYNSTTSRNCTCNCVSKTKTEVMVEAY